MGTWIAFSCRCPCPHNAFLSPTAPLESKRSCRRVVAAKLKLKLSRAQLSEENVVHRLGKDAAGLFVGLALLLSSGDVGYGCPSVAPPAETMSVVGNSPADFNTLENEVEFGSNRSLHVGAPQLRSSHPEARILPLGKRGDVLHEGLGESSINYREIVQSRDDMAQKRSMFTEDAWVGMNRLKQYAELVEQHEAEEKVCPECARNRRLLEQVWQTVSNEYYDQYGSFSQSKWSGELYASFSRVGGILHSRVQTYAAIKGMVGSLGDTYSAFLNPEEYRIAIRRPIPSEIKYLAYQYTGVGVELRKVSTRSGLTVVAPFAGSPAEEAGILAGDQLLRVDDIPVDSLSADEAVALLRGPIGSTVDLELSTTQLDGSVRRLSLERRALPLPPLRLRMMDVGDGRVVAYLRLHYFTHEGTKKMAASIREGEALGVDGYVLDLRNNPGGVFEEAIAMAALWLDCDDCDVTETVRNSEIDVEDLVYSVNNLPEEIFKRHPGALTHAPLAVITNHSSASASEVFTGAVHDNHRAILIGETTFGKGVVQYFFPMDDGSGLKLTVAKYLTPSRYDISKQGGLKPDIACSDYPHGQGQSDECVEEALGMLATMQGKRPGIAHPAPLPYRWLPLSERRLWASESY